MDIAINCRCFLNRNYTGIGRYAFNLIKSLGEIDQENNYLLYARRGLFNHNRWVTNFGLKNFKVKMDWFHSGPEKSLGKIDIFHSPSPESVGVGKDAKIVVTVHDLIFKAFPQGHTQEAIEDTGKNFENIRARAARIICCSKNTVQDLKKYFLIKDDQITLVYQGVDKNIFYMIGHEEETLAEKMLTTKGITEPYLLFVGTIEPRKNLKNILRAFGQLKEKRKFTGKLVVAGMKGWMSEDIGVLIQQLKLTEDVLFVGFLTNQELRYFYNKAEALLFPSFYEGFGFPIVEAFCCGTPVITSNVSSCPEIAEDAALMVDPFSPEEIASAVIRMIGDVELRRDLREKGFKRAGDFNFRKTAEQTLAVYREVYRK